MKVLAFAGSLRKGSYNKKVLKTAVEILKQLGAEVISIDLKEYPIPLYDADLEAEKGLPKKAKEIRDMMLQADRVLIVTPEYNGSLPGVLKNVIDWCSRNEEGKPSLKAFKEKTFAIISASPGKVGGARSLKDLHDILVHMGANVVAKTLSVPEVDKVLDEKGKFIQTHFIDKIKEIMAALIA